MIKNQIREFILENFIFDGNEYELKDTDSFLELAIVDSTGILELVAFIEETYGFEVEDEELIPANLDSIANVTAYIRRKQTEGKEVKDVTAKRA